MKYRLFATILALSLLTGCKTTTTQPSDLIEVPEEKPSVTYVKKDTTGFSMVYDPTAGFNPFQCLSFQNRAVISLLHTPMFYIDQHFQPQDGVITGSAVSVDGLEHTLYLDGDITFWDGTPVTAMDVEASIRLAQTSSYYGNRNFHIVEMTDLGSKSLLITTDTPMESLPLLLNIPVIKMGTEANPVGCGNYTLLGDQLVQQHPTGTLPEIISLTPAVAADEIRDGFSYGDVNLVYTDPNGGTPVPFVADYELWNAPTTVLQYIGFHQSSSLFSNSTIRKAMTFAVDRETLVTECADGFGQATALPMSPNAQGYDPMLDEVYQYDLAEFKSRLAKAELEDRDGDGILDRFTATGIASLSGRMIVEEGSHQRTEAAHFLADSWRDLGLDISVDVLTKNEFSYAMSTGNYDCYLADVRLSPNFDLEPFFATGGTLSYGGLAQDTLLYLNDQMLENSGNSYNLHEAIASSGLLCPVMMKNYAVYATRGHVEGFSATVDDLCWEVTW